MTRYRMPSHMAKNTPTDGYCIAVGDVGDVAYLAGVTVSTPIRVYRKLRDGGLVRVRGMTIADLVVGDTDL